MQILKTRKINFSSFFYFFLKRFGSIKKWLTFVSTSQEMISDFKKKYMKTSFNEKEYSQSVVFQGIAEIQVLQNSLQEYIYSYGRENWDAENMKWKESYNENHHNLIRSMYEEIISEYIKD